MSDHLYVFVAKLNPNGSRFQKKHSFVTGVHIILINGGQLLNSSIFLQLLLLIIGLYFDLLLHPHPNFRKLISVLL